MSADWEVVSPLTTSESASPAIPEGKRDVSGVETQEYSERLNVISSCLNELLPEIQLGTLIQSHLNRHHKTLDQLDDDILGSLHNAHLGLKRSRFKLVELIADRNIRLEEVKVYLTALLRFVKIISTTSYEPTSEMKYWVVGCPTTEYAVAFQQIAEEWESTLMVSANEQTTKRRRIDLIRLFNETSFQRNPNIDLLSTKRLFSAFHELYSYVYSLPPQQQALTITRNLTDGAVDAGIAFNDPMQVRLMLELQKQLVERYITDQDLEFVQVVVKYACKHGLSPEKVQGLVGKLLPAMQKGDPQVSILNRGGDIWGMKKGDFGVGDFLCHAYASQINSVAINELLLAAREVPATTLSKFEQNRQDALKLLSFGILRDFIHDQQPHVHEVLAAMVNFYDTDDEETLKRILQKTDYLQGTSKSSYFNRSIYEQECTETNSSGEKTRLIEILRRLVKNTEPVPDDPPTTSDTTLNNYLQACQPELSVQGRISKINLQSILEYINGQLARMMNEKTIGVEPNLVLAISWIERRMAEFVKLLRYEDQQNMNQQPWLGALLQFQELIGSPEYKEQQFQEFLHTVQTEKSFANVVRIIGRHILLNLNSLTRMYTAKGRTNTDAVWSGNLAHELLGLIDAKPTETAYGSRHQREMIRRVFEPGFHPGD